MPSSIRVVTWKHRARHLTHRAALWLLRHSGAPAATMYRVELRGSRATVLLNLHERRLVGGGPDGPATHLELIDAWGRTHLYLLSEVIECRPVADLPTLTRERLAGWVAAG